MSRICETRTKRLLWPTRNRTDGSRRMWRATRLPLSSVSKHNRKLCSCSKKNVRFELPKSEKMPRLAHLRAKSKEKRIVGLRQGSPAKNRLAESKTASSNRTYTISVLALSFPKIRLHQIRSRSAVLTRTRKNWQKNRAK